MFCLVFHPHGWIKSEQIVELIDHAVAKHGKKVKFLTFREAQERLDKNLLGGQPLRDPATGEWNGVQLLDVNNDGYLDVVIGNDRREANARVVAERTDLARRRLPDAFDLRASVGQTATPLCRFAVLHDDRARSSCRTTISISFAAGNLRAAGGWPINISWRAFPRFPQAWLGRAINWADCIRFRDIDGDGRCELIATFDQSAVYVWSESRKRWIKTPFGLPTDATVVNS